MPLFEAVCVDCGTKIEFYEPRYTERNPFCQCGGLTERIDSVPRFHDWNQLMHTTDAQPYVTRNITKDGSPLEIRSHKQLEEACKANGVIHVPGKENRIG